MRGALLELRGQFRKLQWFGEVNRRGFAKITKKLDKIITQGCTQRRYLSSKVNQKPFSTDLELLTKISEINDWLSFFGEDKCSEDTSSAATTHSALNISSKETIHFVNGHFDFVVKAIRNDDASFLEKTLEMTIGSVESPENQRLLINLLQRAISCKSKQSIRHLLEKIENLDEPDDINNRNCLHRLIISFGRAESVKQDTSVTRENFSGESSENPMFLTPALTPLSGPVRSKQSQPQKSNLIEEYVMLLDHILVNFRENQRIALISKDLQGRIPLHYAAQLEFPVVSEMVTSYMRAWGLLSSEHSIYDNKWHDDEGMTPIDLSVIRGFTLTAQSLLNCEKSIVLAASRPQYFSKLGPLVGVATKNGLVSVLSFLVNDGVAVNYQDESGETALHKAARFGHVKCAEIILRSQKFEKNDLELTEKKFSWTPLHVACVDGHISIVKLLIEAGADLSKPDTCGWTAKEHAALRGHITIARFLTTFKCTSIDEGNCFNLSEGLVKPKSTAGTYPSALSSMEVSRSQISNVRSMETIKSFGHRYLTNKSLILVSLGSMDMRKNIPAVKLEEIPITKAYSTQLDTALSLIVSAEGAQGDPVIIDLPVQENMSTDPSLFTTIDTTRVKLFFDVVPTYSGNQQDKLGRGVALMSSIKRQIGVKRMDLQGDVSIPILSTNLEVIGTVNFNCLIITPFSHPNMHITEKQTYWKEISTTMVIGHRGLGKNMRSNKSLQLGENTIQSFIAAANLGAHYVEFDVQLTKDLIPVIYHDFLVSETGIDAPVHTLTLEQFLHVNDNTTRASRPAASPNNDLSSKNFKITRGPERQRSQSLCLSLPEDKMSEKMKHTRDFKEKGFKANSRGNFIQAPFTTLEEMFLKLPENVGFNIEMKYPMLHESENHDMDTFAVELNSFVDTVLSKVYDLCKKRKVILSSFNPDICLLLSFKQPSIPILFLTDAGTSPVGDIRASSLHEAIKFASRWNLLGIVSAAEPLCNSPRLVKVVKENGLVCVSYGMMNNDPAMVQVKSLPYKIARPSRADKSSYKSMKV